MLPMCQSKRLHLVERVLRKPSTYGLHHPLDSLDLLEMCVGEMKYILNKTGRDFRCTGNPNICECNIGKKYIHKPS